MKKVEYGEDSVGAGRELWRLDLEVGVVMGSDVLCSTDVESRHVVTCH